MNAFTASPGGGYAESAARSAAPGADDPYISIGIDGRRFRVFYARGRAYWVSAEMRDGHALPGVPLATCVPDCLHAQAAALADAFLEGWKRAQVQRVSDALFAADREMRDLQRGLTLEESAAVLRGVEAREAAKANSGRRPGS